MAANGAMRATNRWCLFMANLSSLLRTIRREFPESLLAFQTTPLPYQTIFFFASVGLICFTQAYF